VPGPAAFTVEPDELVVLSDDLARDDFEDLLAGPAAAVELRLPDYDPADDPEAPEYAEESREWGWAARLIIEEGVVAYIKKQFDAAKHPRWPKDAPNNKGGEFMQIGERFVGPDGKPYEIGAIHGSKIVAQSASGNPADVKEITLDAKDVAKGKVKAAPPKKISSDKTHSAAVAGAVTLSPFVEPSTHDPSIPKPASLHISDEEWKRFGKEDQEHFLHVEERFGAWSPGKSKTIISQIQQQYEGEIQQIVSSALSSQYGSSSGHTLNLASAFGHLSSDPVALAAAQKKYEKAKLLLRDTAEAIHWDLYHRTKGPDVAMFHWGGSSKTANKSKHTAQGVPIMSAYSLSTGAFATTQFGSVLTAVPIAVRHVEMHTHSGGVYTDFSHEWEITTGARMLLDDRALFTDASMPSDVKKYLQKMAKKGGEPASGAVLYEANKALKDAGYDLPLPPEKPEITPIPIAGGPQSLFKPLPPSIAAKAAEMAPTLGYSGGSMEAATGPLEHLGVKPGDFIEGMKGTRYIIIEDPGDPTSGLRYVKLEAGAPNYAKSWHFSASAGNDFRRLEGHLDIPVEKKPEEAGFVPFTSKQYDALMEGPQGKLATFQAGDMFKADGEGYKVVGPHSSGKIEVESLDTGKHYLANSAYKPKKLVPTGSFVPPEPGESSGELPTEPEPEPKVWKVGDKVLVTGGTGAWGLGEIIEVNGTAGTVFKVATAANAGGVWTNKMHLSEPPAMPGIDQGKNYAALAQTLEKGDKFGWKDKNYTVTNVTKGGMVKAKPQGGGPVEGFPASELHGNTTFYRPSTWAVGNKAKVGDLDIGDVVQAGAGGKIRPYMVENKAGSKVWLRNLETGGVVQVTKKKQYARLLDAKEIAAQDGPGPGEKPSAVVKLVPGPQKKLSDLDVGDAYDATNVEGLHYVVIGKTSAGTVVQGIDHGQMKEDDTLVLPSGYTEATTVQTLVAPSEAQKVAKPELNSKFDQSKYVEGDKAKLKDLEPGSLFVSATGLPMQLKSNTPKGGATAGAWDNGKTVKNISYDKPFATLVEKDEAPFDHANLAPGDTVELGNLKPGDVYSFDDLSVKGGQKYVVKEPLTGDQMGKAVVMNAEALPVTFSGSVQATYHGSGLENHPAIKPLVGGDIHADKLPLAPDYVSYMHPKSGKNKYDLVKDMAPGSVFLDKGGKAWKVKQSGGQAVITDGEKLYSIDGSWRGKLQGLTAQAAFLDKADLPQKENDDSPAPKVGDLAVGDKFTIPVGYKSAGDEYVVMDSNQFDAGGYTTVQAKKVGSDELEDIATDLVPAKITKPKAGVKSSHPNLTPVGEKVDAKDLPANYSLGITDDGKAVYKNPAGYVWVLGTNEKVEGNPKIQPAEWTGPDAALGELKPSGQKFASTLLPPGAFFEKNGKQFLVLANTHAGITAQLVGPKPYIGFATHEKAGEVEALTKKSKPPELAPTINIKNLTLGSKAWTLGGKEGTVLLDPDPVMGSSGYALKTADGIIPVKGEVYINDPLGKADDGPARKSDPFFQGLSNGDEAYFPFSSLPVVVMDNQIPGPGIKVKPKVAAGELAAAFTAYEGELVPMSEAPQPDPVDKVAALKEKGLPKVSGQYTMLGHLPLGTKVETPDGTLEVTGFKNGEMTFMVLDGTAAGDPITLGQATSPPSTWYLASGEEQAGKPGQWPTGWNQGIDPPAEFKQNTGIALKDLKVGDYYAFKDDHGLAVLKVTEAHGGPGEEPHNSSLKTDVAGSAGMPSPSYKPEYVWQAESPAPDTAPVAGKKYKASDLPPGSPVKMTPFDHEGGTISKNGLVMKWEQPIPGSDSWQVFYAPDAELSAVMGSEPEAKPSPAGQANATFQQVKEGHLFAHGDDVYLKLGHGTVSGWAQKKSGSGPLDVGEKMNFPLGKKVTAADEDLADAGNPLEPYLHPKSGKYKYVHLHTLPAGTEFTDKKGGKYKVVGHVGGFTQFTDDGQTFAAPSSYRVKVTKPVNVEEARLTPVVVMLGDGRLAGA
jgi:hypothetical protein